MTMIEFPRRPLVALLAVLALAAPVAAACDDPVRHGAGRRDVTVTRPNGSTFTCTLHYPATADGVNAPFDASGGRYPILSFGHGFLSSVTLYQSTLAHLARCGFFAIASQSQGGLFPSHAAFAEDLRFSVDWLVAQDAPGGAYAGAVATDAIAFGGHSMGGGAAILAAKDDARERALVTLAAANTNPSSNAAMASVATPTMLIVGTNDTIVPPQGTANVMYANALGPRQIRAIVGGGHCGFIDSPIFGCDNAPMPAAEQRAITRDLMVSFLRLALRGEECAADAVWGEDALGVPLVQATLDPRVSLGPVPATASAPRGGVAAFTVEVTNAMATPRSFGFGGEAASFEPATLGPIAPGATVTAVATFPVAANAKGPEVRTISVRSLDDGSTYAFLPVTVEPAGETVPGDLDGNGIVDGADLTILLSAWGPCPKCPADLDRNGTVDAADLAILLAAWEP